jgi:hypothetical protein
MEKTIYSFEAIKEKLHNHNVIELVAKDGQDLEVWYHPLAKRYEICVGLDENWVLETKSWLSVKRKLRQLDVEVA